MRRPPTSSSAVRSASGVRQEAPHRRGERRPLRVQPVQQAAPPPRARHADQVDRLPVGDQHPALRDRCPRRRSPPSRAPRPCAGAPPPAPAWLLRMSAAMRSNAPNTGSNSSGGCPACGGIGWPRPSARAERRRSATGRESVREARWAPTSAAATPASVVSSRTSARSSWRTAREESSASCGVASTPMSVGAPGLDHPIADALGERGNRPVARHLELAVDGQRVERVRVHQLRHHAEILEHLGAGPGQPSPDDTGRDRRRSGGSARAVARPARGPPPRTNPPAVSTASRSVWVMSRSRLRSTSSASRAKLQAAKPMAGSRKNAPSVTASRMRNDRAKAAPPRRAEPHPRDQLGHEPERRRARRRRAERPGRRARTAAPARADRSPRAPPGARPGSSSGYSLRTDPSLAPPAAGAGCGADGSAGGLEGEPIERRLLASGIEQPAYPAGHDERGARADGGGHHLVRADPHQQHVVHAGHPRAPGVTTSSSSPAGRSRTMVESSDGGRSSESSTSSSTSAPARRPERQVGRIALRSERRAVPERVHRRGALAGRAPGAPARRTARAAAPRADRARCRAAPRRAGPPAPARPAPRPRSPAPTSCPPRARCR